MLRHREKSQWPNSAAGGNFSDSIQGDAKPGAKSLALLLVWKRNKLVGWWELLPT
jgi:hypothetical protein